MPSSDSVKVAVRVRPFSQVSIYVCDRIKNLKTQNVTCFVDSTLSRRLSETLAGLWLRFTLQISTVTVVLIFFRKLLL